MKRSWKSRAGELLLWVAVALITAAVMIAFTDKILPAPNF
jgi:Mg/Co/Ni transporter MgtE